MLDRIDLLRDYKQSLRGARIGMRLLLEVHHDTLRQQREVCRRERLIAQETLRRERERTAHVLGEYKRTFARAQAEAKEYQIILEKAKREGRQLLRILELLDKQAA